MYILNKRWVFWLVTHFMSWLWRSSPSGPAWRPPPPPLLPCAPAPNPSHMCSLRSSCPPASTGLFPLPRSVGASRRRLDIWFPSPHALFNWSPADPDFLFINHYSSGTHSGLLWGLFTQRISFFRRTASLPHRLQPAAISQLTSSSILFSEVTQRRIPVMRHWNKL